MGLREQFEKYDIITDEDIARGIVYAWIVIVLADAKVESVELMALERFAKIHNITRQFNQEEWLSNTVGEALSVYKSEGMDTLLAVIQELLDNTSIDTKRILLFSLMQLACIDGDFTQPELDMLNQVVELLDISRGDVLMMGMLFATYRERSS
jgi:tellurite resistance protein